MIPRITLILAFLIYIDVTYAREYYGARLGSLKNSSYGLSGEAWLVNETAVQITNFRLAPNSDDLKIGFFFSTKSDVARATQVYKVLNSPNGAYSKPIDDILDGGFDGDQIVIRVPKNSYKKWNFFGVVAERTWNYLAALKLDKSAPKPFCCITNPKTPNRGVVGRHYGAGSGPVTIQDAKTVVISNFELEGTRPPDAWIYAGSGEITQKTGRKALIVGRDSPQNHCSIHEDYNGSTDLVAVLADDQTVYDINYISVFCYQYDVNFGNVRLHLNPEEIQVPPYVPPVRDAPPPQVRNTCPLRNEEEEE